MRRLIMVCCDYAQASLKLAEYVAHNFPGHDILLMHVHCKATFLEELPEMFGEDFEEGRHDNLDAEAELREISFVEHTLCPHMKALGVDVRSEVLSIDGWDNRDISAALCKRAGELHPELMVLSKHRKSPVTMFFISSITRDCFRHASCPVLFV